MKTRGEVQLGLRRVGNWAREGCWETKLLHSWNCFLQGFCSFEHLFSFSLIVWLSLLPCMHGVSWTPNYIPAHIFLLQSIWAGWLVSLNSETIGVSHQSNWGHIWILISINGDKGDRTQIRDLSFSANLGVGSGRSRAWDVTLQFFCKRKKYFLVFALLCFSEFFNVNSCLFCTNEKKSTKKIFFKKTSTKLGEPMNIPGGLSLWAAEPRITPC